MFMQHYENTQVSTYTENLVSPYRFFPLAYMLATSMWECLVAHRIVHLFSKKDKSRFSRTRVRSEFFIS